MQMYIIVGTLVSVLLFIMVILAIFCGIFARLKQQETNREREHIDISTIEEGRQNLAFNHAEINSDEELSRRGFVRHVGQRLNRYTD